MLAETFSREIVNFLAVKYFGITAVISALWFASIPVWKPFMTRVLGFTDADKKVSSVLTKLSFVMNTRHGLSDKT